MISPASNILALSLLAALLPGTAAAVSAVEAPSGWTSTAEADLHVFSRTYPQGQVTVHLAPWRGTGGDDVQIWLDARKAMPSDFDPVISTENEVQRGNEKIANAYYVLRDLRPRRGKPRKSLLLACGKEGQVRSIDVFGPAALFKGKNPDVLTDLADVIATACREEIIFERMVSRPELTVAIPLQKLESVWYLADFVVGFNGYEVDQESVLVFADNTVTSDASGVLSEGIKASRRALPDRWGEWRMTDGKLEIKWGGSKKFRDYFLATKTRAGDTDERLDACYSSSFGFTLGGGGSAYGGGSTSIAINKWCFGKDGRFSNDGTVGISGSTGTSTVSTELIYSGYSRSDKTGWYRIDGHIIQLVYDDGRRLTKSFGLTSDDTALLMNGRYYD